MDAVLNHLVCISILLLTLSSCDKNSDERMEVERNYTLGIKIEYIHKSETYPDAGSLVYIYFNHKQEDFTGLQCNEEGVYYSNSKIIRPDGLYIADADGIVSIDFKEYLNIDFSIVVESYKKEGVKGFLYIEKYKFKEDDVICFKFHE